jgi:hypothetical protein
MTLNRKGMETPHRAGLSLHSGEHSRVHADASPYPTLYRPLPPNCNRYTSVWPSGDPLAFLP